MEIQTRTTTRPGNPCSENLPEEPEPFTPTDASTPKFTAASLRGQDGETTQVSFDTRLDREDVVRVAHAEGGFRLSAVLDGDEVGTGAGTLALWGTREAGACDLTSARTLSAAVPES